MAHIFHQILDILNYAAVHIPWDAVADVRHTVRFADRSAKSYQKMV
jgi:L-rhamnose isomerase